MLFIKAPKKKVKFLNIALEALKGNLGEEHIIFTRSSKVKITGPEDMDWALDGEYQKGCSEIIIENKKQALTIMVPPEEEEEPEEETEE